MLQEIEVELWISYYNGSVAETSHILLELYYQLSKEILTHHDWVVELPHISQINSSIPEDFSIIYTILNIYSINEMHQDMCDWEAEQCIDSWLKNGGSNGHKYDKPLYSNVSIEHIGDNYSIGYCEFGKVWIPNIALQHWNNPTHNCKIQFNGFENSRKLGDKFIAYPLRCLRVYS